jgi:hypothetical protein
MTAPDDRAESDLDFFLARPNVSTRIRLAFENEPPPGLERDQYDDIAFISVRLERDVAGLPATIHREIVKGEWGTA